MNRVICLFALLVSITITGCDRHTWIQKFVRPEDESTARGYVDLLRQGKLDQIQQDFDPSIVDPTVHDVLVTMAKMLPAETPKSVKVVGVHTFQGPAESTSDLTLEYEFPSKWILISIVTKQTADTRTIVGFHINPIPDSLERVNRFTFEGKRDVQYFTFVAALGLLIFNLYALITCLRIPHLKRKWLWSIFVFLGVGKLTVDWTTGHWEATFVAVQVPCASATALDYGPWVIALSFPLGALVFLIRHEMNTLAPRAAQPIPVVEQQPPSAPPASSS
jgi:hypothetical protein